VLDMVVDRAFGHDQRRGNLAVAAALCEQAEHFKLTFTEPADVRSAPRQSVTSDCENGRGRVVLDAAAANLCVPDPALPGGESLSRRELDVLRLLGRGACNHEVPAHSP
jgi:hypothetical protein